MWDKLSDVTAYGVVKSLLNRPLESHKGDFGTGLLIAGSKPDMPGCAMLAAKAAFTSGIGKVVVATHHRNFSSVAGFVPEAIFMDVRKLLLPGFSKSLLKNIPALKACAIGPGIGKGLFARRVFFSVYETGLPMVIDADALTFVKGMVFDRFVILTPHEAEFARLISKPVEEVRKNRLELAIDYAEKHKCVVVLKGHKTISTIGPIFMENNTGNPGMATAGSGDVLTGIILALLCQGQNEISSAIAGAYIHGLAGDLAAKSLTVLSLRASDIISFIPQAFKETQKKMPAL